MCITKTTWKEKEIDASNAPVNVHMWSIYLCLRFHQSLHTHKEESSLSDSKSAAILPQLKRVKRSWRERWLKKTPEKDVRLCWLHYPHIYDHFLLKKMFFYMKFWVWGNFFRTMKLTSLSGFYYFYFFLKKKYLWIDQNRGTSFDLTLSFQIIWCTSQAPFDEQQRAFEERERAVLCWEIYKNI